MSNLQGVRDRLRFVKYDGASSDKCLQLAVKAVQKERGRVQWTNCDQVDKELIYVLGNFDCPPYKKVAGNARVIGPMVILELATKSLRLPLNPVFTMTMHGLVVCCTQTGGREARARLQHLVKMMGGRFTEHFTRNVTHLVAGQVGSTKYKVARKLCIPIVKPSWIETCWDEGMEKFFDSKDKALLSAHWCPVLSGCVITSTGFSLEDRGRLQKLCQENGAEYSGQLVRDACTHLIVGNKSSEKYRRACQWRVVCVSMQWIYDSVKAGYCLDEEDYSMAEKQEAPKQTTDTAATRPDWTKELDQFVVPSSSSSSGGSYLDGCKIYFTGFSDLQLEKLCKLVNYGGGVRYNRLSEHVSHVVVGVPQPSELATIAQLHNRPAVVLSSWLLDCCRRNMKLSEKDYKLETNQEEPVTTTTTTTATNVRKRKTNNTTGPNSKKHNNVTPVDDNDDLMSQYQDAVMPEVPHANGGTGGLFSGMTVAISDRFPTNAKVTITTEVTKHGGSIVTSSSSCTYYVVPLAYDSTYLPHSSTTVVTILWLERCLEEHTILPPTSYFLFSPLPYSATMNTLLSDCVLTISQYTGVERDHLVRFGQSLGARVQDSFARYPSGGVSATTHLILREPVGEKYRHCLVWGIPAIKDSWLFACAKAQRVVSLDEYRVLDSHNSAAATTTTPTNARTRLSTNASSVSMDTSLDSDAVHFKTPLKSFHPHFDVKDAVEGLASQVDGPNTQMATMFHTNMEKALETVSEYEKKAEMRGTILQGVVICVSKKLSSLQVELHNIGNSLGAHCQWSFSSNQCTHYLYQGKPYEAARDREVQQARESGCFIVSHHWLLTCSTTGVREDESLFPFNYNPQKALSLSTQKSPSSQLEKHSSTAQDVPMLDSRVYGLQREETQIITEEEEHNEEEMEEPREEMEEYGAEMEEYGAEMEEHGAEMEEYGTEMEEHREEEMEEHGEEERENEDNDDDNRENVDPPHQGGEQLRRQIQLIMENASMNHKRYQAGALIRRRQQLSPAKLLLNDDENSARRKSRQLYRLQQSLSNCDSLPTDSQAMPVTYNDPEEWQKLLAKIQQAEQEGGGQDENFESLSAFMTDTYTDSVLVRPELTATVGAHSDELSERTDDDERGEGDHVEQSEAVKEVLPPATQVPAPSLNMPIVAQCKPTNPEELLYDEHTTRMKTRHSHQQSIQHKFLLSSLNLQEKADYGALIQELGGVYLDTDHFVVDCTHLIVGRSSRTEKYLAACASGKWVLNKSYMEACRGNGSFVEEEAYEWRGAIPDKRSVLDDAPRKWRLQITKRQEQEGHTNSRYGAFDGWKVLLCVESSKMSGLRRVLEAGGAEVFLHSNMTAIESGCVTQAFINMAVLKKLPHLSLEYLVEHDVLCLKPDYIADYLQKESDPRSQQYVIPEAWHLMNTK